MRGEPRSDSFQSVSSTCGGGYIDDGGDVNVYDGDGEMQGWKGRSKVG